MWAAEDLDAGLGTLLGRIHEPAGLPVLDLRDDSAHAVSKARSMFGVYGRFQSEWWTNQSMGFATTL